MAKKQNVIQGTNGNNVILGMAQSTTIGQSKMLLADAGSNYLVGGDGAMTGTGSTTYRISKESGHTTIDNYDIFNFNADDLDVIQFTGVNSDEATYRGEDYDLIIDYGPDNSVRIKNYFMSVQYSVDEIHFADKIVNYDALKEMNINITLSDKVAEEGFNSIMWKDHITLLHTIHGTSGNDVIHGSGEDDIIYAGAGNDIVYGKGGNDELYGEAGNDKLYGGAGNDLLVGGKGNDLLVGGNGANSKNGNKTYLFSKGDGQDRIDNYDVFNFVETDIDTIKFTDVVSTEATYHGENYDLIVTYGANDTIRIENFFKGPQYWINEIEFTDKKVSVADLQGMDIDLILTDKNYNPQWPGNLVLTMNGDETDNILVGTNGNDVIYGHGGNDTIFGQNGNDKLYGGDGNDAIYGGKGNDLLVGGKGDDTLIGGDGSATHEGNKTYQFSKGDGHDLIRNYDLFNFYAEDKDIITFTDVSAREASYHGENYDLVISYGEEDTIRIEGFFKGPQYWIDEIHFADQVLTIKDLQAMEISIELTKIDESYNPQWQGPLTMVQVGTEQNDTLHGTENDDVIKGKAGDDLIFGYGGNDKLYGGDGNDIIYGGEGNDLLDGGQGDDILVGGDGAAKGKGNKTYTFNRGDGQDVIQNFDTFNFLTTDKDIIIFKDVLSDEMRLTGEDYDLIISYSDKDSVIVENFFKGGQYWINEIHFADTILTLSDLKQINIPIRISGSMNDYNPQWDGLLSYADIKGTEGDDIIHGTEKDDVIHGYGGNDIIYGKGGDDKLYGGSGNDIIYGGAGNDLLVGGIGNDTLIGSFGGGYTAGIGNKIYQFSKGDGQDTVINYDIANFIKTDNDIIAFTNVRSNEATYRGENYDLIIEYGQGDSVRIQNFFKGEDYWINEIHFTDKVMSHSDLEKIAIEIELIDFEGEFNPIWKGVIKIGTYGTAGNDILHGTEGDDIIYGLGGNDTIYGNGGNDKLFGGSGNDILYAGSGNDLLVGGTGRDTLIGESTGNKTYQFSRGDGQDTIRNYHQNNGQVSDKDIIDFTNVNSAEASYRGENYDLIIDYGSGDSIRIENFFKGSQYWINEIHFADRVITHGDLERIEITITLEGITDFNPVWNGPLKHDIYGTDGRDIIHGTEGNDVIYGLGGNDTIYGKGGNDKLFGGSGNDIIYAGSGNDLLVGGTGSDTLIGESTGNKTYQFSRGDGQDTIRNYHQNNGQVSDKDIIDFTNVNSANASYRGEGYDLIIDYGKGDSVRVENFFKGGQYWINEIHFADKVMTHADLKKITIEIDLGNHSGAFNPVWDGKIVIAKKVIVGTSGNDVLFGTRDDDTILGLEGNDTIYGGTGNDQIYGNEGDDTIYAGSGNDFIVGGTGNDLLIGGDGAFSGVGNKTYYFERGDGRDTIRNHDAYNSLSTDKDIIEFGDVKSSEASYRGEGYDLIIDYGRGDSVRIENFFRGSQYWINEIHFADKIMTHSDLQKINIKINLDNHNGSYNPVWNGKLSIDKSVIYGSNYSETIHGTAQNDTIYGLAGNDIIYGYAGNDTLEGGDGNDTLYGGTGNDILNGGRGNDYLVGGEGSNSYYFSQGDGHDRINNYDQYNNQRGNHDVVYFGTSKFSYHSSTLRYSKHGNDLILKYGLNFSDSVTIEQYFNPNGKYWIDEIHLADKILTPADVFGMFRVPYPQGISSFAMAEEMSPEQELHSLINAMSTFEPSNETSLVGSDPSFSPMVLTAALA